MSKIKVKLDHGGMELILKCQGTERLVQNACSTIAYRLADGDTEYDVTTRVGKSRIQGRVARKGGKINKKSDPYNDMLKGMRG